MKRVFCIEGYNKEEGSLRIIGRTIVDFEKADEVYIRNKVNSEFVKVEISKIITYRVEVDELNMGLTAAIYLNFDYDEFSNYDRFLFEVNKGLI